MKKKLQKYLSGDHEGFSLVELIIVIAIMAILIGVVALAVIPYLQRSRESKDLSTLDTVRSSLVSAVATTQVTSSGQVNIDKDGNFTAGGADATAAQLVADEMKATLGAGTKKLGSKNAAGHDIVCVFDASNNTSYVYGDDGNGKAAMLEGTVTGYNAADATTAPTADDAGKALVVAN